MNEREFASKIKQDLNYGLGQVPAGVNARLKAAREQALQAFATREVTAGSFALAGHGHSHAPHIHHVKWMPLAVLLLALAGIGYWQATLQQDDDVDAALLASDLPLNAYVDHDFHSWLDQTQQR
jgi:hypothetical protein